MAHLIEHPCVQHKLAILRDEETGHKRFRELSTEKDQAAPTKNTPTSKQTLENWPKRQ